MVGTLHQSYEQICSALRNRLPITVELGGIEHRFYVMLIQIPDPRVGGPVKFNELVTAPNPASTVSLHLMPEASDIGNPAWKAQFDCVSGVISITTPSKA